MPTANIERPLMSEDVVSFSTFRRTLSDCMERTRRTHRPIIVTQNGHAATITFAIADFESHEAEFAALRARANLNKSVEISRRQFERGECLDHKDVMRDVHAELQLLKEKGLVR